MIRVPERLGYAAESLLCFPTEEERQGILNQGAPFYSVCETLHIGRVPSISRMLLSVGFRISEELVAAVRIRCDPGNKLPSRASLATSDSHDFPTEACPSEGSRFFLPPIVRTRMKELCKEVCLRDADGVMLADRSVGGEKRSAWVIAKVMEDLEREFDEHELRGIKGKTIRFIDRSALAGKRLTTLAEQD